MPRSRKPKRFDDYDDVLTVDQAAELLHVTHDSIYDAIHAGQIPAMRIGRRFRISKEAIRERLNQTIVSYDTKPI
ncbi:MAG: helix-turn-helix domain-containing protein [Patescibacteria group bacterium]